MGTWAPRTLLGPQRGQEKPRGAMTGSAVSKKMGCGHQVGPGHVVPPEEGCPQGGGGKWGSEKSPRSHFESRKTRDQDRRGQGQRSVVLAQPPCAPYLLNAQEPDILPHDLLWGELEEEDRGEGCSGGRGGRKSQAPAGLWALEKGWTRGPCPSHSHQSSTGSPMDTHTQRRFVPGIVVRTGGQHARCNQHSAWYAASAQQV